MSTPEGLVFSKDMDMQEFEIDTVTVQTVKKVFLQGRQSKYSNIIFI